MATQHVTEWRGQELLDNDGDTIGTIEEIYLDAQSGEPEHTRHHGRGVGTERQRADANRMRMAGAALDFLGRPATLRTHDERGGRRRLPVHTRCRRDLG